MDEFVLAFEFGQNNVTVGLLLLLLIGIGWNRIGCRRGYPKRENRREISHAKEWFRRLVHPSLYDVRNMFESSPK